MIATVKNVKTFHGHDGGCYEASIYIDGKKVGGVTENGWGGGLEYHFASKTHEASFKAWADEQPLQTGDEVYAEYIGIGVGEEESAKKRDEVNAAGGRKVDADILVSELVNKALENKQYKRWCKKDVCFRLKGDTTGEYRTLRNCANDLAAAKIHIDKKFGNKVEEILNERLIKEGVLQPQ